MRRRDFLTTTAATGLAHSLTPSGLFAAEKEHGPDCGPGFANPEAAMKAPREKLLYATALYVGTPINKPDYLATIDVDPDSPTYGEVIDRLKMPNVGDELHHFGWNTCSSCNAHEDRSRDFLIVPGLGSSRIHIVDARDERALRMHKIIEPEEIAAKTNLTAPHTVHCLPSGEIMISMLGDAQGNGPGGFLLLDDKFDIVGRWEESAENMRFNYDFWYQPRHNVMVSSEWAAPNTFRSGFDIKDVEADKYGHQIHFWHWPSREIVKTVDMGADGLVPLEVRFMHNPDSTHGYVGAALSSTMWHCHQKDGQWHADNVIAIPSVELESWPMPVPALITDLLISMDDRFLYFSNWLHGDIRQYDISDPAHPKLTGQVWCGGLLGKGEPLGGKQIDGGPQMIQLSLDGKRLYVTTSLLSSWDNQFYPNMAKNGSCLLQIDCDTENGGMKINKDFLVDFGKEPDGPARAHEVRYPGGDCTSDIFI